MNTDIRLSVGFWDHPKIVKLERRLGLEGVKSLQILWLWAAQNRPDGVLDGMDAEDIEIAAKWNGVQGSFKDALTEINAVDFDGENYILHGWKEHNEWQASSHQRSDSSRFNRMAKTYSDIYEKLKALGVKGVSADVYSALTGVNGPSTLLELCSRNALSPFLSLLDINTYPPKPPKGGGARSGKKTDQEPDADFFAWWEQYPRKEGKKTAINAWCRAQKEGELPGLVCMLEKLSEQKQSEQWRGDGGKFIPHPSSYLNQRRWEDETNLPGLVSDPFEGAI